MIANRWAQLAWIATGMIVAGVAWSQTLYKLVDKNGKITYSETVPKGFDGKVTPINIDPNANTATLPKPASKGGEGQSEKRATEEFLREGTTRREDAEARVQAAKDRVEEARNELNEATLNPGEGDVTWIGNVGGGTRSVRSEAYVKRLAALEAKVAKAEEDLKRIEREAR
jgi:hypothetical protein